MCDPWGGKQWRALGPKKGRGAGGPSNFGVLVPRFRTFIWFPHVGKNVKVKLGLTIAICLFNRIMSSCAECVMCPRQFVLYAALTQRQASGKSSLFLIFFVGVVLANEPGTASGTSLPRPVSFFVSTTLPFMACFLLGVP